MTDTPNFGEKNISISKQAFSKARYKISPHAFEDIFHLSTGLFRFTNHPKTWDGYRVFAVDGSETDIDHNKNNETEFGLKGGNQHPYPFARLTAFYDVMNALTGSIHIVSDIHKGRTVSLRVIKDTSGEQPHILVSNQKDIACCWLCKYLCPITM